MKFRGSPRLKTFDYVGFHAYFITSPTRGRQRYLANPAVLEMAESCLLATADEFHFRLLAYCLMPDHVHILPLATEENCDLKEFVRRFKQRSSFRAKKITGQELWQISFHDRVARCDEDLPDMTAYIWYNPVRAGLVSDFREYRGSGPRPLPNHPH